MATRYLTFALQFISSIYIAVKLGAYYWGIWSFILLLTNMGVMLDWGIGNSINILLVQYKNEPERSSKYCYNGFILSCLIMIPMILFTLYERIIGIPYFEKYHVGQLIYAILLVICISYLNSFFVNLFRVKNRLFAVAFSQSAFPVVCFLLMFFATGKNLLVLLALGNVAATLASLILFLAGGYVNWKEQIDWKMILGIFLKGFFLFCYNACFLLIVLSTKTIISYYYPVQMFGYFAFAFSLANAAMLLVNSFTFVAFPKMIDMLKGTEPEKNIAKIDFLRQSYILCISGIVYLAIPGCKILLYFIPKYQMAFKSFVMIILALAIYPLCYGFNTYMLAQNKEKVMAVLVGIAVLLNLLLTYTAAAWLHVTMEYCAFGIMAAYALFAMGVNIYAGKMLRQSNSFLNILKLLPLYFVCPFGTALLLLLCNRMDSWFLIVPFLVFLFSAAKEIWQLRATVMKILRSPEVLNIK